MACFSVASGWSSGSCTSMSRSMRRVRWKCTGCNTGSRSAGRYFTAAVQPFMPAATAASHRSDLGGAYLVAHGLDLVMVFQHALVLAFDDGLDICRQRFFERFCIAAL